MLLISLLKHTIMYHYLILTISKTMYLFEANLNLVANTSTPDVAQYHFK